MARAWTLIRREGTPDAFRWVRDPERETDRARIMALADAARAAGLHVLVADADLTDRIGVPETWAPGDPLPGAPLQNP